MYRNPAKPLPEWAKKFNFASLTASLQNYLTCLKHYFSLLILPCF